MSEKIAFGRGSRKPWKKVRPTGGGLCFTVSWDRFEKVLRGDTEALITRIKDDEYAHRFEVDELGVTVFLEKNDE